LIFVRAVRDCPLIGLKGGRIFKVVPSLFHERSIRVNKDVIIRLTDEVIKLQYFEPYVPPEQTNEIAEEDRHTFNVFICCVCKQPSNKYFHKGLGVRCRCTMMEKRK